MSRQYPISDSGIENSYLTTCRFSIRPFVRSSVPHWGLPPGSEALLPGSEALLAGFGAHPAGSEGLAAGSEALPAGPKAHPA